MRTILLGGVAVVGLALVLAWIGGELDGLTGWALEQQRSLQQQMAGGLRALHRAEPGALAALWGLCFTYGFVHAIGPGHGKFLIGTYGAGTQVAPGRLMGVGLLASLAQGASAVLLVYGGVLIFDASREALQITGDLWLERASLLAIAAIGCWLLWRGVRRVWAATTAKAGSKHYVTPHEGTGQACGSCGHRHGPTPEDMEKVGNWREMALLIGAIALRPCTGALFLLVLTWRMGLIWQGIAGAMIMALGTASVTVAVAALAVGMRDGATVWAGRMAPLARLGPVLEFLAGLVILLLALNMLK